MIEYVSGTNPVLPVIFRNTGTLSPVNGVTSGQVFITIIKPDRTVVDVTVDDSNFYQVGGLAYTAQGYYQYVLDASIVDVTGVVQYCALTSGSAPYFDYFKYVGSGEGETSVTNTIQVGTGSVSVDMAPVLAKQDQTNATLGAPITTVSRDILEVARLVKMSLTGTRR